MTSRIRKITLERTPCHGPCPVYRITVLGTGEVEYFGEAHVARPGAHRWRISRRRLERLAEAFERARYSRLEDSYTNREVTDAPGCLTSIEYEDGSSKCIVHYHGDPSAPDALTELEDEIDRIVGVERYTESDFPPEGTRASTATYLLTFNPEKSYKWEDLRDCIDDVRDHGFYATAWSCGRNRRITAGDRVFMMRQGSASGSDAASSPRVGPRQRSTSRSTGMSPRREKASWPCTSQFVWTYYSTPTPSRYSRAPR